MDVLPAALFEAVQHEAAAVVRESAKGDAFKFGKRTTWWLPLRAKDGAPIAPRSAIEAAVHELHRQATLTPTLTLTFTLTLTLTLTLTFTLTRARVAPAGLRRDARRAHSGGGVVGAGAAVACRHRLPLRQGRGLRL